MERNLLNVRFVINRFLNLGIRKYACRCTLEKNLLNVHIVLNCFYNLEILDHIREKPLSCLICNESFLQFGDLRSYLLQL